MTGSAAKGPESAGLKVAPDLNERLARLKRVEMPFAGAGLTAREKQLVQKLVDASRYIEDIYWRQIDPPALELYETLGLSTNPKDEALRRFIWINASRYDRLDEDKPFVGATPLPAGRSFYPPDLTREKIEQYVKDHPEQRDGIYNGTSIVRWHDGQLEAVPYHIAYRAFLEPAAKDLREAAALSGDPGFASFLRMRADALLSDDYFKSDLAWVDLKNPKIDIIFAPYENYEDDLLGVKTTYGAAVMIRNQAERRKLEMFQKYIPDIQDSLPLDAEDRPSKRGTAAPMEVVDNVFRSGDMVHGYESVADNLPNDARIHEQKGSKRLFFKNFMDARVTYIILPVARKVMVREQAAKVAADGYLSDTIMHEICHGIGPAFSRTASGKLPIQEALGPAYSGWEEAKADVCGLYSLKWLADHDVVPKSRMEEYYASHVADYFRTARFGVADAHAQAGLLQFNYFVERGAIKRMPSGQYAIDFAKMPDAVASLNKELLQAEATGDRAKVEDWMKKYGTIPDELKRTLKMADGLPIEVDPVFTFKQTVK
ncbi:MAG TPA: Zn-dependent hydrolase [Terriglobales bacterium]